MTTVASLSLLGARATGAYLLKDEDAVEADNLPLLLDVLLAQINLLPAHWHFDHSLEQIVLVACLLAFRISLWVCDLRVEVLVEVGLLDELETVLGGHLDESIEGYKVLIDVLDGTSRHLLANRILQVKVILEAKWTIIPTKCVLTKHNAKELVAYGQVFRTTSLSHFVDKSVRINRCANKHSIFSQALADVL